MSESPSRPLYRPGGPIEKIVQVKLSTVYETISAYLLYEHNSGIITVPDVRKLAAELVERIEMNSKSIAVMSSE